MKKIASCFCFVLLLLSMCAQALTPLPSEQAFSMSARFTSNNKLQLVWQIAPGYHLYRERFNFKLLNAADARLAAVKLPTGIPKPDDILGKYEIYQNDVVLSLDFVNIYPGQYRLQATYQGCADSGFCYPPVTKQIILTIAPPNSAAQIVGANQLVSAAASPQSAISSLLPQDNISRLLARHNWLLIISSFLLFGLLLAFTPCVLPMLPILSSIILGQGQKRTALRSFYLSSTYALAIASAYAVAGMIAALAGSYVQAVFQSPWLIALFSLLFALLSLSLFGLYEMRLPQSWNQALIQLSQRQRGGTYLGVFIMGCLSVLIVSPCVTAPLIGALSYLSASGDIALGGAALFALGAGMGIPLIIVGTFEGKFLPKSGPWLVGIKALFGVLLIALAIWLLERIIPARAAMLLWAAFCIILSIYLGALGQASGAGWQNFRRGSGIILLIYGSSLLVGALQGNTNLWQPLRISQPAIASSATLNFRTIKSVPELQQILAVANARNKPVLVDFYADWCVACKEMDAFVFQDAQVRAALKNYVLLRADVTANDAQDKQLEQTLNVLAPPTVLFYGVDAREIAASRIVGAVSAEQFLRQMPR